MRLRNLLFVALVCTMVAMAQTNLINPDPAPAALDTRYQVRYATNFGLGESWINIVNTGANGAELLGPGFGGTTGNICVNVYAFAPDEQLVSCCSCLITPNAVKSLGAYKDLASKALTGIVPDSIVVKLVGTVSAGGCSNSAALAGKEGGSFPLLRTGFAAWGTTVHAATLSAPVAQTETAFTPATLSVGELASMTNRCANIIGNGSTYGQCASCALGAKGGFRK